MEKKVCRADCNKLIFPKSIYCSEHKCSTTNCLRFTNCPKHRVDSRHTCKHIGCIRKIKSSKIFCRRHSCEVCEIEVKDGYQVCEDHRCTFDDCDNRREEPYISTCGRHYCTLQGCRNTDAYCREHMCIGTDAGCEFPQSLPDFLQQTYSEGPCPVHGCDRCCKFTRRPEEYGHSRGLCQTCYSL